MRPAKLPATVLAAVAAVIAVVGLSGCGSQDVAQPQIRGRTLTIYASAPLLGSSRVSGWAMMSGARLALSQIHDRIGEYRIAFKELNDATVKRGGWDPGQTTINARTAVLDRSTIGYLGDLDSGASAVSIPPLNRAGIPQVSPASTAVGLTSGAPGSYPGEPQKYYPTGVRTFARVVPNDSVQAIAQVRLQRSMGCRTTYVLDDEGEVDGADTARSFEVAAQAAHLRIAGIATFARRAADYRSVVAAVVHVSPDCVLISADTESGAVLLTKQLAQAAPGAKIFGSAGLAESTYADPAEGGIPLSVDSSVLITVPTLGLPAYPAAARVFTSAYERQFGAPEPDAIFGYEAMSLLLSAISQATDGGTEPAERSKVRAAIFATRDRPSVLGIYSIDRDGDTSLRRYGVYRIIDGRLTFWKAIDA